MATEQEKKKKKIFASFPERFACVEEMSQKPSGDITGCHPLMEMSWFALCVLGMNCHIEGLGQTDPLLHNPLGLD